MTTNLQSLKQKWDKVLHGCAECNKRRAAIKKVLGFENKKVALMFSGGLDSTYAAWKLKQDEYAVTLFHVEWQYNNTNFNTEETASAIELAHLLELPFVSLGTVNVPVGGSEANPAMNIMRVPTIGSMLICHRTLREYGYIGTGLHPSEEPIDQHWHELLQQLCDLCMPGTTVLHPADGVGRNTMGNSLPPCIRTHVYSCFRGGCGQCEKCISDQSWRINTG